MLFRPISRMKLDHKVIRGQYNEGFVNGGQVKGYRAEENVDPSSNRETFIALEMAIDNCRWAGTPFYLRSGKGLPKRQLKLQFVFHHVPNILFLKNQKKYEQMFYLFESNPMRELQ